MKTILITGGAGYIGSHTCVELINNGHNVCIIDSLRTSSEKILLDIKETWKLEKKTYKL